MKYFFDPSRVALVGASSRPLRPGNNLHQNLELTFGENYYPVNPKTSRIGKTTCYPSVLELPGPVDLAIVFIPAAKVPQALSECGQAGIKRVIVESGGFAEVGGEGLELNRRCLDIAREHGMRLWGPNCMGAINVSRGRVMSFMSPMFWQDRFRKGPVSLVVQSGMLSAGFLARILTKTPFGLSKVCSIGNKMDVDETDILEYLVEDPDTGVIAMYLESLERGRRFFELAKKTGKPIVALKSGRTGSGQKAAASHTASMAQDDAILDAALRQAGVIRCQGMKEMMDLARSLGARETTKMKRARVAVLSFSGGAGVVTADELQSHGLELASFSAETNAKLAEVFPHWMDPQNPVDLYPGIEKHGPGKVIGAAIEATLADPGVDALFLHVFAPPVNVKIYDFERIGQAMSQNPKPMVAWVLGSGEASDAISREFESRGAPVVGEIERGARVLSALTLRK